MIAPLLAFFIGSVVGMLITLWLYDRGVAVEDAERIERRSHALVSEPGESGFGDQTYGPAIEARYSGDGTRL